MGPNNPEAMAAIAQIDATVAKLGAFSTTARFTGDEINQMIAQGGVSAMDTFAQSVAEGEGAIKSLGIAFRKFAADFLRQMAMMILQRSILNALSGGSFGSGIANFVNTSVLGGGKKHAGGVVGPKNRLMPASMFQNALRYHGGGIAGLRPNEVPTILKGGQDAEEVLTADDPRHVRNGGGAGSSVKIINLIDPVDLLEKALNSPAGERVLINHMGARAGEFKAVIG